LAQLSEKNINSKEKGAGIMNQKQNVTKTQFRFLHKTVPLFICVMILAQGAMAEVPVRPVVNIGHKKLFKSLAATKDLLVSGSVDKTIRIWDVQTGRLVRKLNADHIAYKVAIRENLVFGTAGSEIRVWNIETGKVVNRYPLKGKVQTFDMNGKYLVVSDQKGMLHIFEAASGKPVRSFIGFDEQERTKSRPVSILAVTDNAVYSASQGDDNLIKRDFEGNILKRYPVGEKNNLYGIDVMGNRLVTASMRGIRMWDLQEGRLILGNKTNSESVAIGPGVFVTGSDQTRVYLWDLKTGGRLAEFKDRNGKHMRGTPSAVAISNGKVFAGIANNDIFMWDLNSKKLLKVIYGSPDDGIKSLALGEGRLAAGFQQGTIRLWDLKTANQVHAMKGHKGYINFMSIDRGKLASVSGGGDYLVKVWDLGSARELRTIKPLSTGWSEAMVMRKGRIILGERTILSTWSADTGRLLSKREFKGWVSALAATDKRLFYGQTSGRIKVENLLTGRLEIEMRVPKGERDTVGDLAVSAERVVAGQSDLYSHIAKDPSQAVYVFDAQTGKLLHRLLGHENNILGLAAGENRIVSSSYKSIRVWNLQTGEFLKTLGGHSEPVTGIGMHQGRVFTAGWDNVINVWNLQTGKRLVTIYPLPESSIAITPEGYFGGTGNYRPYIHFVRGTEIIDTDRYFEAFYRPDLVTLAMSGGSLDSFPKMSSVKSSPKVRIVNTPQETDQQVIPVTLEIEDTGGGIGDVRVYRNGAAVAIEGVRGIQAVSKNNRRRTLKIRLEPGENRIEAVAFNADGTLQSDPAQHHVVARLKPSASPGLNALLVGIQEFRNPRLNLQFPVADAKLMAETLKRAGKGLFSRIHITLLTSREETTRDAIIRALKVMRDLDPSDLFVFFVASHGTVDDGNYYLLTADTGSTSTRKLKETALDQNQLKMLIASIPTTKKVIILDTCSAQALGDAIQVAMMTRGMSESTAMKVLSRAVGSTILSAATSAQEAVEGYNGHGLFTWVVHDGLSGKADADRDGFVKTTELANYVDDVVPELAECIFKRPQFPVVAPSGQGFPLSRTISE
jgi:WD40 repeat protein